MANKENQPNIKQLKLKGNVKRCMMGIELSGRAFHCRWKGGFSIRTQGPLIFYSIKGQLIKKANTCN